MKTCVRVLVGLYLFLLYSAAGARAQGTGGSVDFDNNGEVEFADFVIFARGFGKKASDAEFDARLDLNGNNEVDFADFLIFARRFGESNPPSEPEPTGPQFIYIVDLLGGKIDVLDVETNLIDPARTVQLSQPRGLAFSDAGSRIYVAAIDSFYALTQDHLRDYQIPLLDPPDATGSPAPRGGFRVALSPDSRFAYVTEEFVSRVEIIDLQSREVIQQIPLLAEPLGIAVSSGGDAIYVGTKGQSLAVINGAAQAFEDSIALGGFGIGRLALAPDGSRIYTGVIPEPATASAQLVSIDPSTKAVVNTLELAQPGDLSAQIVDVALSKDGSRLYATLTRVAPLTEPSGIFTAELIGSLITVNTETFQKIGDIRAGDQVANIGLAPDEKTAYVSGIRSLVENPVLQVIIVDLGVGEAVGALFGFDLPVHIQGRAGKPALLPVKLPEIAIF